MNIENDIHICTKGAPIHLRDERELIRREFSEHPLHRSTLVSLYLGLFARYNERSLSYA